VGRAQAVAVEEGADRFRVSVEANTFVGVGEVADARNITVGRVQAAAGPSFFGWLAHLIS